MSGRRQVHIFDQAQRILAGAAANAAISQCYAYWRDKRALMTHGMLPGRQHLDPAGMRSFLPYVVLFDVERNGAHYRFRHRLTGTHFADIFGRDVTGMYIEHAGSLEDFDVVYRRFSCVVDDKALVYGVSPSPLRERNFPRYEHLTLPLATDGATVDMLFGVRCWLSGSHPRLRDVPPDVIVPLGADGA